MTYPPTCDYFEDGPPTDPGVLDELVDRLADDLERGWFLMWEAVQAAERGEKLTKAQKRAVEGLISFADDPDDEPIQHIDGCERPSQKWYEIVRTLVPHLLRVGSGGCWHQAYADGWPMIADALKNHAKALSLPPGVKRPIDLVPRELQEKLWYQNCQVRLDDLIQNYDSVMTDGEHLEVMLDWLTEGLADYVDAIPEPPLSADRLLAPIELPAEKRDQIAKWVRACLAR